MKGKIIRNIRNLFDQEKEHYKPVNVGNFWRKNYIEGESNADETKTLSTEEYLNKNRLYLKDAINDLNKSGT